MPKLHNKLFRSHCNYSYFPICILIFLFKQYSKDNKFPMAFENIERNWMINVRACAEAVNM